MTDEQKKKLEQKLWDICNTLRGKMGADDFRDYILGFIFYKYLSERMHQFANDVLTADGVDYLDIKPDSITGMDYLQAIREESKGSLGYFLKPEELFSVLARQGQRGGFILEDLKAVLQAIERSTMGSDAEEDFVHLFDGLDLTSVKLGKSEDAKNDLICKVMAHLDEIDFRLHEVEGDVLGDAYEYLIGQFASGAGKKAGEFYTPQKVSSILAQIVSSGKTRLKSVYDPTCGSGSLLLRVARQVKEVGDFYGQEMNPTTFNLARMNMILHGVHFQNFDIKNEDTLERPQHEGKLFEAIVANPPFSAKWSARPTFLQDDRFAQFGRLAPASKADYAFLCHMLAHLADNGAMAVVLPHGVLFRGGAEGEIRRYLLKEKNWLDAVIGLPANIFYGTGIPTCILVFRKCRTDEEVLFIDASQCFEKGKNENRLRDEDVERIVATWQSRPEVEKFSHRASLEEIAANDFNLNIPRYVDTFEAEARIDLGEVTRELKAIEANMAPIDARIRAFCAELGLEAPV